MKLLTITLQANDSGVSIFTAVKKASFKLFQTRTSARPTTAAASTSAGTPSGPTTAPVSKVGL